MMGDRSRIYRLARATPGF